MDQLSHLVWPREISRTTHFPRTGSRPNDQRPTWCTWQTGACPMRRSSAQRDASEINWSPCATVTPMHLSNFDQNHPFLHRCMFISVYNMIEYAHIYNYIYICCFACIGAYCFHIHNISTTNTQMDRFTNIVYIYTLQYTYIIIVIILYIVHKYIQSECLFLCEHTKFAG